MTNQITPIQLHITNTCNLRCKHCYHDSHSNSGALNAWEWKKIILDGIELCNEIGTQPLFIFAGGEPILCPFLAEFVRFIREKNPQALVAILTNGTLLSADSLNGIPTDVAIQVSIDGPDATRHDFQRGNGSFEAAKMGIREAQKIGFQVQISTVLSRRTAKWISEFFRLADNLGVQGQNFTRLIPAGQGKVLQETKSDAPILGIELRDAYREIVFQSEKWNVPTNTSQPLFQLIKPNLGANGGFGFSINIDHQGNFKPSARNNQNIGNVRKKPLNEIFFKSKIMNSLRNGNFVGCKKCSHRFRCGGDRNAAHASSGNFLGRDPGCWNSENYNA